MPSKVYQSSVAALGTNQRKTSKRFHRKTRWPLAPSAFSILISFRDANQPRHDSQSVLKPAGAVKFLARSLPSKSGVIRAGPTAPDLPFASILRQEIPGARAIHGNRPPKGAPGPSSLRFGAFRSACKMAEQAGMWPCRRVRPVGFGFGFCCGPPIRRHFYCFLLQYLFPRFTWPTGWPGWIFFLRFVRVVLLVFSTP